MGGISRAPNGTDVAVTQYKRCAAVTWVIGGALWFALEAIAASAFRGYSYARYFISDLGNPAREVFEGRLIDSQLAWIMNVDFVVHGLAFLLGALFAFRAAGSGRARYVFVTLVALNALGGIVVATIHSSNFARLNGTEPLHGLAALISILGGNLAIVVAGVSARSFGASKLYRMGSVTAAVVGITSLIVLVGGAPQIRVADGIWERASVYPIMLWEIITGTSMLFTMRTLKRVRPEALK